MARRPNVACLLAAVLAFVSGGSAAAQPAVRIDDAKTDPFGWSGGILAAATAHHGWELWRSDGTAVFLSVTFGLPTS